MSPLAAVLRVPLAATVLLASQFASAASPGTYACLTDGFASFGHWPSGPGAQPNIETQTPPMFKQFLMVVTEERNPGCDSPAPPVSMTSTRWWQCQPSVARFNPEFPISILRGTGFGTDLASHDGSTRLFVTANGRFTLTSVNGSSLLVGSCVKQ